MQYRSGNQIREDFLRFFEEKGHRRVHSSSLVPHNDPTLLFSNAGMNQFKDVFLGAEQRPYTRATSSQKCVRAGGKHNDLENVGFTRRHHTFFEMLGNFSFGDYFKQDAIAYAWELLTSPQWFGIDPAKLYVTIFEGDAQTSRDDEAEQFWLAAGVPQDRIYALSAKDNFWQMGETGPCGPCSEIYYDLGLEASSETGPNGEKLDKPFGEDDQRYMEIWNLVFMQFDRAASGELTPLPKPSIDTGMGLERIACVLQGKLSNYQSDLFTPLIARAAELTGYSAGQQVSESASQQAGGSANQPGAPPSTTASPSAKVGSAAADDRSATHDNTVISTGAEQLHRSAERRNPHFASVADEASISDSKGAASLRIIADHARAATFLIADGVIPSNEGRGYVLRKILRRGIRHGRLLGQEQPFMHQMVYAVRDEMQTAYPELNETADRVSKTVLGEEQQFARVMAVGARELDQLIDAELKDKYADLARMVLEIEKGTKPGLLAAMERRLQRSTEVTNLDMAEDFIGVYGSVAGAALFKEYEAKYLENMLFDGRKAFRLYETFGLPLDFIQDAVRDRGLLFDAAGFERAKEEEQGRARASWKGGSQKTASPVYTALPKTDFEGYGNLRIEGAKVLAVLKDGISVRELEPGEQGDIVLDATSFFADSGGQVGDTGWLYSPDGALVLAEVSGCTKPVQGIFAHRVIAKQPIERDAIVSTVVDGTERNSTMRNHTGTHLLHAALREVLGTHVKQAGSLVNRARLRFDFSHFAQVADEELQEIEDIVNREILANNKVETFVDVPIDTAIHDFHATALFGEKYGDKVRVVKIGDFSTELCGGTHTAATGEIGLLKLTGESSAASGIRRVEAVTGTGSLQEFRRDFAVTRVVSSLVGGTSDSPAAALEARLSQQDEEMKKLRRELEQARMKAASASTADAASSAIDVQGIKVLAQRVTGLDRNQMRSLVDSLRTKLGSGVVVLGAPTEDGKVALIAGVTKDLTARVQAGKIVGAVAAKVGGKGGGRPDLAEAGGTDPSQLDTALAAVPEIVQTLLA
ncbi:alanine--tRNA ligase [Terriglobus sp.]|uniref:alanine--tRNA ligase n=1 Tax=Terriglobus sp. TaxID=1889013 RepID=UPI003B002E38